MKAKLLSGFIAAWIITSVVVVFFASAALAGEPPRGKGHRMPTFADVDSNADGVIVAEELYAMQAKRMAERAEAGGKMKHAGKRPGFEDIDVNGDGEVTPEEFAAHQAAHQSDRRHAGQD